jgi:hypothetical protein
MKEVYNTYQDVNNQHGLDLKQDITMTQDANGQYHCDGGFDKVQKEAYEKKNKGAYERWFIKEYP